MFGLVVSSAGSVVIFPIIENALPLAISNFICATLGGPENTYQWIYTRDNAVVSNVSELSLSSTAIIGGTYQCFARNQAGVDSANATLNGIVAMYVLIISQP